jgi:hypothetical protein
MALFDSICLSLTLLTGSSDAVLVPFPSVSPAGQVHPAEPSGVAWVASPLALPMASPVDTAWSAAMAPPVAIPPDSARRRVRLWAPSSPSGRTTWFYRGLPYGSESLVHPLRLILNGGLGILQFDNRDNRLRSVDFGTGWRNVWDNLAHPTRTIGVDGWWSFFQREVIPISFNADNAQYWPNYTLHLIGGGMSYRMMTEWFAHHGHARPSLWAGTTIAAYHLLNEVVENDSYVGPTTDPIADLYIFDPASVILFSHEGVSRFFGEKLHMVDWSYQPAFDFDHGTIENQGQNFSIKVPVPRTDHWSFFYYFGTHGEAGLSYRKDNGSAFSLAGGLRAKELVDLTAGTKTVDLVPSFGFFYDRDGSLMFSALFANTSRYKMRVNAYPGLLRVGAFAPGLFFNLNRDDEVLVGIDLRILPHLPLGVGKRP